MWLLFKYCASARHLYVKMQLDHSVHSLFNSVKSATLRFNTNNASYIRHP